MLPFDPIASDGDEPARSQPRMRSFGGSGLEVTLTGEPAVPPLLVARANLMVCPIISVASQAYPTVDVAFVHPSPANRGTMSVTAPKAAPRLSMIEAVDQVVPASSVNDAFTSDVPVKVLK